MIRQGAQRTFRNRLQLHLMPTYGPCFIGVGGGGGGYWGTRFHSLSVACLGIVVKKTNTNAGSWGQFNTMSPCLCPRIYLCIPLLFIERF